MSDNKIKILIVEDHALTRFGLKTALQTVPFIEEIFEAEDGESAIEIARQKNPDMILMDLGLSGIDGIETTSKIKEILPDTKVIILTSHNNQSEILQALSAGAKAYCMKDIKPDNLISVIETVKDGAVWFDPSISNFILGQITSGSDLSAPSPVYEQNNQDEDKIQLTDREAQVLKLIVDGYSNADIAKKLYVSIHTAKAHVCNILQKLSVDDRTQAAIKAHKDNLV